MDCLVGFSQDLGGNILGHLQGRLADSHRHIEKDRDRQGLRHRQFLDTRLRQNITVCFSGPTVRWKHLIPKTSWKTQFQHKETVKKKMTSIPSIAVSVIIVYSSEDLVDIHSG